MIDVSNEESYRPASGVSLGDRRRCCVDEGVVAGNASLLIEKNEMLLRQSARIPKEDKLAREAER